MKIKTHFDYPPIPVRDFDWSAIDDETYGGDPGDLIGRGPTEAAAVEDLMTQIAEREDERESKAECSTSSR